MGQFDYVRKTYGVPAKRGMRVRYYGEGRNEFGTITSSSGGYVNVRLDGWKHPMPFHPTWMLEYEPKEATNAD